MAWGAGGAAGFEIKFKQFFDPSAGEQAFSRRISGGLFLI